MSEKKTLILIDGHALAFRQFYALERTGLKNSENQPTWAVYGFFKAIFDLLAKIKPDFIAVAFDVGRQTFRVEKFKEYKANREAMPDTLRCQIGTIVEGLNAFDIPIYTKEGFEAYILFVIQMKPIKFFKPNDSTHKAFGDALRKARDGGVRILAYDSTVTPNSIKIDKEVPIKL